MSEHGSRRDFLGRLAYGTAAAALLGPLASESQAAVQLAWRYCRKCHVMFFDGYPAKGRCSGGGGHAAEGYNFSLSYDVRESPQAQGAWRYCAKCHAMFFDGYPHKGACAGGGGHAAQGYVFVLPHDIRVDGLNQGAWRFCNKCHAMFFDGYPDKGRCPASAGHTAQGFNFVLRYRGNLEDDVVLNPVRE